MIIFEYNIFVYALNIFCPTEMLCKILWYRFKLYVRIVSSSKIVLDALLHIYNITIVKLLLNTRYFSFYMNLLIEKLRIGITSTFLVPMYCEISLVYK